MHGRSFGCRVTNQAPKWARRFYRYRSPKIFKRVAKSKKSLGFGRKAPVFTYFAAREVIIPILTETRAAKKERKGAGWMEAVEGDGKCPRVTNQAFKFGKRFHRYRSPKFFTRVAKSNKKG